MAKIKNISPLGDLIIPALNNLVVKAGESVEVSDEAAASLLAQSENWVAADRAASTLIQSTSTTSPADSIPAASN